MTDELANALAKLAGVKVASRTSAYSFKGKKALLVRGTFEDGAAVVTPAGWRTEFLTNMGFTVPDTGGGLMPREKMASVLDGADVLIWTAESDDEQAALLADPIVAKLQATIQKRNVFTGKDLAGAIAFASTLSYPVVADQLPPRIAQVLA